MDALYNSFARNLQEEQVESLIDMNCTKVVVGTGQWDAGHTYYEPTSFPPYDKSLWRVMNTFAEMFYEADVEIDLIFRTTQ